jgi:high affinity Mn2+ porin
MHTTHSSTTHATLRRATRLLFGASIVFAHDAIRAQTTAKDSTGSAASIGRDSAASASGATGSAQWQPALLGTQITVITQHLDPVRSPYAGPNSLGPNAQTKTSDSYGVYGGVQVSPHLQGYLDVEMIRGSGINHVTGLAGPTNGDVIRQGTVDLGNGPYVARAFVRYTIPLAGASRDTLARGMDQIATVESSRRIEIVAGKFALTDMFDLSRYANNTRLQFMNWGLMNNTAWDYAADTRGYTNGVALAWVTPDYTLRLASAQMPTQANGNVFDDQLNRAFGDEAELTANIPGAGTVVRTLAYFNEGRMGDYADAIAIAQETHTVPNIAADDQPGRTKYGFGLNLEQPLADSGETGLFARLGWDDGNTESFVFTEVDRHASLGAQVSGAHWHRSADRFGIGGVVHGLATPHEEYLAAGGSGFLLGDGALNYGHEEIVEAYYRAQLGDCVELSPDFQYIRNPGYNRDRGPATVPGVRLNLRY